MIRQEKCVVVLSFVSNLFMCLNSYSKITEIHLNKRVAGGLGGEYSKDKVSDSLFLSVSCFV